MHALKLTIAIGIVSLSFSGSSYAFTILKAESCASWNDFIHVTDPYRNTDGDESPYNMRGKMHVLSRYLQYAMGMAPYYAGQQGSSPYFSPTYVSSATDASSGLSFNMFTGMNDTARTEIPGANPNNSSAVQISCSKVGSFLNSYAANLPASGISGGGPQTIFGYRFFDGQQNIGKIYANNPSSYISLQGSSQVLTDWHGSPFPACQLSLLLEINKISTHTYIPFTFKVFDNTNPIVDGATRGNDGNYFYEFDMVSGVYADGKSYPKNAALFSVPYGTRYKTTWTSPEFNRITFTKGQMTNLLKTTGDISPNLNDYQLTGFFYLHEMPNATASLGGSCGAQMQNIGMYVLP